MLSSIALSALRTTSRCPTTIARAPVARAAAARCASRFSSGTPFAVDAPDGDHDLQELEESRDWASQTLDVASVVEDTAAINAVHDAVLGKTFFAVDAPNGEHDLEDVEEHKTGADGIINEASMFENPEEVKEQQRLRKECLREANRTSAHDF